MHPYTALCPVCSSEIDLTPADMSKADGDIICGNCNNHFHAPDHLLKGFYAQQGGEGKKPPTIQAAAHPVINQMDSMDGLTSAGETGYLQYKRRKSAKKFFGVAINGMLLGIFLLQLFWIRFDDWVLRERLRPVYSFLCSIENIHCRLPTFMEPADVILDDFQVDIRDNSVYVFRADMFNRGSRVQPLPWVEVSFFDASGSSVAFGRFSPYQYLADYKPLTEIRNGQEINVLLEIRKPVQNAASYTMKLVAVAP